MIRMLVMLFFVAASVEAADRYTLNIANVVGMYGVNDYQVQEIYKCAAPYFRKVGINFRVKYSTINDDFCYPSHTLQTRNQELDCLSIRASQRRKTITYFMTPPFITEDNLGGRSAWIAGVAKLCGNVSTGNATPIALHNGYYGQPRIKHSANAMAHEVFHNMCAVHLTSDGAGRVANLMHPDANSFTWQHGCNLLIFNTTKRQVKRWYARNR